nr:MAG TPA: hypothetical protein [Caudoviricetes sp.]
MCKKYLNIKEMLFSNYIINNIFYVKIYYISIV